MARKLLELGAEEAAALARDGAVALIPVGQVVPHGRHLPLGADALIATGIAERLAGKLDRDGQQAVVAPGLPIGHSPLHREAAGTLSLRASTAGAVLGDLTASLARWGFRHQVLLLHAPGTWPSVALAAEAEGAPVGGVITIDLLAWLRGTAERTEEGQRISAPDGHAGALETSIMLHLRPDLADPGRAPAGSGPLYGMGRAEFRGLSTNERLAAFGVTAWERLGDGGVVGDASEADPAVGAAVVEAATDALARHISEVVGGGGSRKAGGPAADHGREG